MSASQRRKGAAFEREIVTRMNEYGADAERNLSQSRDGGYDIDSLFGAFECKKRAALPAYLCPVENVRGVVFAQDRGERLVLLRFEDAMRLMALERKHNLTQQNHDRREWVKVYMEKLNAPTPIQDNINANDGVYVGNAVMKVPK